MHSLTDTRRSRRVLFYAGYAAMAVLTLLCAWRTVTAQIPDPEWEEAYDRLNIRRVNGMVSDSVAAFLQGDAQGEEVARVPPRVDFGIVQLTPEYLPDGSYGGWGETRLGPDNRFYFCIGNHRSYGADAMVIAYDPATKRHETLFHTQQVCGWTNQQYGDGKIHGDPDVAPNGDLWVCTYPGGSVGGAYPSVTEFNNGTYVGGHIVYYNIYSKRAEDLGRPVPDDNWPMCSYDWQRDRLYAVGEWGIYHNGKDRPSNADKMTDAGYGKFLVYDTRNRRVIYGDLPPDNIRWYCRALFLDRVSGKVYGSECVSPYHLVCYDPATNRFTRMSHTFSQRLHSAPQARDVNGALWFFDIDGNVYRFHPDSGTVQRRGKNWGDGEYVQDMCVSPGGRYLYYVISQGGQPRGFPVIQMDVVTGVKKAIAFINAFCHSKYGYSPENSYGCMVSRDGSSLFFYTNGIFCPNAGDTRGSGRPAMFHVFIPAAERAAEPVVGTEGHYSARLRARAAAREQWKVLIGKRRTAEGRVTTVAGRSGNGSQASGAVIERKDGASAEVRR